MDNSRSTKKESVQIYLNFGLVDQKDDFVYQNKKQLSISKRKRLNRTTIIGLVLQDVFDNYSKFGHNSELWRIFSKWLDD